MRIVTSRLHLYVPTKIFNPSVIQQGSKHKTRLVKGLLSWQSHLNMLMCRYFRHTVRAICYSTMHICSARMGFRDKAPDHGANAPKLTIISSTSSTYYVDFYISTIVRRNFVFFYPVVVHA